MLRRHWAHAKASAPTLEQKHRKYYLRCTYEEHGAQGTVLCVHLPQNKTGCITFYSVIPACFFSFYSTIYAIPPSST